MGEVVVLRAGDEAQVLAFLEQYVDSSLFFFNNIGKAGLEDHGLLL